MALYLKDIEVVLSINSETYSLNVCKCILGSKKSSQELNEWKNEVCYHLKRVYTYRTKLPGHPLVRTKTVETLVMYARLDSASSFNVNCNIVKTANPDLAVEELNYQNIHAQYVQFVTALSEYRDSVDVDDSDEMWNKFIIGA
jgi:hypothetical protein